MTLLSLLMPMFSAMHLHAGVVRAPAAATLGSVCAPVTRTPHPSWQKQSAPWAGGEDSDPSMFICVFCLPSVHRADGRTCRYFYNARPSVGMRTNAKIHHRVPYSPRLSPNISQMDPVDTLRSHVFENHNVIPNLCLSLARSLLPSGTPQNNFICMSLLSHACYIPCQFRFPLSTHPNNILTIPNPSTPQQPVLKRP
jgi:hypothetical protein